jgi:hypothetical protein
MEKKTKIGMGAGLALVGVGLYVLLKKKPSEGAEDKANLYGKVTDANTNEVIPGVKVALDGKVAYTDSNGGYYIGELEPGEYALGFSKAGYETIT